MNILRNTVELIGSIMLFSLFLAVSYGILIDDTFFTYLGKTISSLLIRFLLWLLEYVILPIIAFFGLIKAAIWLTSGPSETESELELFPNSRVVSPPLLMQNEQNVTPVAELSSTPTGVGEQIIVTEHTDTGGIFHHTTRGSALYREVIAKNANRQREEEQNIINEKSEEHLKKYFDEIKTKKLNRNNNDIFNKCRIN